MKKIIIAILALTLIFTVAVSVGAKTSPKPKEYYDITVSVQGSGEAEADPYKVKKNTEGTTTLTATDKDGFFTRWIISGEYTIIDGSLDSKTLVILPKSDIQAIASFSKEKDYLNISTSVSGDGSASAEPSRIKKGSGDTITLTATDGNDKFVNWVIQGDYDIISGDLKSRVLVIRPKTDINAIAYFNNSGKPNPDDNAGSPKTGDILLYVIGALVAAFGIGFVAFKKLRA